MEQPQSGHTLPVEEDEVDVVVVVDVVGVDEVVEAVEVAAASALHCMQFASPQNTTAT